MKKTKSFVLSFLPVAGRRAFKRWSRNRIQHGWERGGRQMPPPHQVKQVAIAGFAAQYKCSILVETGTFMGDMLEAQKENFRKLYSIELSAQLWETAKKRFRNDKNISLMQGDSAKLLHALMPELDAPTLFWLDGHYSGGITAKGATDCPVFDELDAIFGSPDIGHVMLIDDARLFVGTNDYPTLAAIETYVAGRNARYKVTVADDIIRVFPAW